MFVVNGRRDYGAYDIGTLSAAVRAAGARATLTTTTNGRARREVRHVRSPR
jgi:hypothetical protein